MKNKETFEENKIKFYSIENKNEILKLCENGDIFINGRLAENDKEVVNGLREFLIKSEKISDKKYSEEEVLNILNEYGHAIINEDIFNPIGTIKKWFNKFKKK